MIFEKTLKPKGILKNYVDYICVMESDEKFDFFPKQRIYTYGCVVLVFHYRNPSFFKKRDGTFEIEPRTVICGQQTSYYDLCLSGNTGMIFVIFKPFAAGLFFKVPMNEIANQNIALEYLIKDDALWIEDKIVSSTTVNERIKIIEEFLVSRLLQKKNNHDNVIFSFHLLEKSKGNASVKQLAFSAFLSVKQFERKFSELVGLNPKQYLRIKRFRNICEMRKSKCFEDYTKLAYDCGYYDQSHFIHDFKAITDLSPKEFFETVV